MATVMLRDGAGVYYRPRRRRPNDESKDVRRRPSSGWAWLADWAGCLLPAARRACRQRDLCTALLGDASVYRSHKDYGGERKMLIRALAAALSAGMPTAEIYAALAVSWRVGR